MHCTTLLRCKIDADQNASLFTNFKIDCCDLLIKLLMIIDPSPVCLSSRACLTAALAGSHGHVECIAYYLIKGMSVDEFLKQMKEDTPLRSSIALSNDSLRIDNTPLEIDNTPLEIDNDSAYDDDSIPLDDNELDELAAVPDIATCLAQLKEPASETTQDHINGTEIAIRWLRQALASDTPYDSAELLECLTVVADLAADTCSRLHNAAPETSKYHCINGTVIVGRWLREALASDASCGSAQLLECLTIMTHLATWTAVLLHEANPANTRPTTIWREYHGLSPETARLILAKDIKSVHAVADAVSKEKFHVTFDTGNDTVLRRLVQELLRDYERVPDTDVELMLQQNPVYSVGRSIDITDLVTIRVYSHSANLVSRWLVDLDEHLLRLVLGVSQ